MLQYTQDEVLLCRLKTIMAWGFEPGLLTHDVILKKILCYTAFVLYKVAWGIKPGLLPFAVILKMRYCYTQDEVLVDSRKFCRDSKPAWYSRAGALTRMMCLL